MLELPPLVGLRCLYCLCRQRTNKAWQERGEAPWRRRDDQALELFLAGWVALKAYAASAPPRSSDTRKIQMLTQLERPMRLIPTATAGLNAPPEIEPTAKAPTSTVKPIARPKYELPLVSSAVFPF